MDEVIERILLKYIEVAGWRHVDLLTKAERAALSYLASRNDGLNDCCARCAVNEWHDGVCNHCGRPYGFERGRYVRESN